MRVAPILARAYLLAAHFHHALEWLRQGYSARMVVTGVLFQMAYTSAFGAFAVFVQLRTGVAWSFVGLGSAMRYSLTVYRAELRPFSGALPFWRPSACNLYY